MLQEPVRGEACQQNGDTFALHAKFGWIVRAMNASFLANRSGTPLRATLVSLVASSAFFVLGMNQGSGEDAGEHLFIDQKDLKSETCLNCHPNKKEGEFVHSAEARGCENCHQAKSENQKTTITLVAAGGDLCAMCHEAKNDPVLHGPYKNGQCLACHDPHASEFKAQTRAPGNSLCLECHSPRRVNSETVTLFNSWSMSGTDFEAIPKIELDATQRSGHPWMGHPVAERPDPSRQGEKMSCLSCHQPHTSTLANLIVAPKPGTDVCETCHEAAQQQKHAGPQKQQQVSLEKAKSGDKQP